MTPVSSVATSPVCERTASAQSRMPCSFPNHSGKPATIASHAPASRGSSSRTARAWRGSVRPVDSRRHERAHRAARELSRAHRVGQGVPLTSTTNVRRRPSWSAGLRSVALGRPRPRPAADHRARATAGRDRTLRRARPPARRRARDGRAPAERDRSRDLEASSPARCTSSSATSRSSSSRRSSAASTTSTTRRHGPRGRRRHRVAGLGRDAAADVPALGRARGLRRRGRRDRYGRRGRHQERDVHRPRAERVRAALRRARRPPARADLAVRRAEAAAHVVRQPRRDPAARGDRRARTSRSTPRTCGSTSTARPAPAGSPSTRRTRPCGSRTCPTGHHGRVPERALAAPEPGGRDADPEGSAGRADAAGAADQAREPAGRTQGDRLRFADPLLRARAVPAGEGPPDRTSRSATSTACSTATSTSCIEAELRRRAGEAAGASA